MKNLLASLAMLFSFHALAQQPYTVHEWGTFTTLCGSGGNLLSGLQVDEEQLPKPVYSHAGFHDNPNKVYMKGEPAYVKIHGARAKMETPVLYFYSDAEIRDIDVRVDFPQGSISQYYPDRAAGENVPFNHLNFNNTYNGWIQWKCDVLGPEASEAYSISPAEETHTWTAPRATDANLVRGPNNETEKFLFYRGVGGDLDLPLQMRFLTNQHLELKNEGGWTFHMYSSMRRTGKMKKSVSGGQVN